MRPNQFDEELQQRRLEEFLTSLRDCVVKDSLVLFRDIDHDASSLRYLIPDRTASSRDFESAGIPQNAFIGQPMWLVERQLDEGISFRSIEKYRCLTPSNWH